MTSIRYTRNLFLRAICIVYLFAFISFYVQIPGLYGDNGILPAKSLLENSKHKTLSAKVHYQPTLLWLAPYIGLDTNYALDVLALLGTFLAFTGFVSQKFCTIPLFAGLWSLYFSLYQVGQVFVTTQWDDLLLEVGFLCLLVAPILPGRSRGSRNSPTDSISFWLVRWLLFRFFVTNGLVKLINGCPKWWDLTALSYHFESMVLPSPLSWYAHHIPAWILKLSAVYALVCEIGLPFLSFIPIRSVRITGFVFQIFLQIFIVLTGNFNILNLLLVALLVSLLDDHFFYGRSRKPQTNRWTSVLSHLFNIAIHAAVFYLVYHLFNIRYNGNILEAKIGFTKEQFQFVLKQAILVATYVGLLSLIWSILRALISAVSDNHGTVAKIVNCLGTILCGVIALVIFTGSTVPLHGLHKSTNVTVDPSYRLIYNRLHKLHAVNEYGLFKKMSGINGRPEIIIEGSDNIEGPWLEYHFLYKPGNVNHSLPFVAPYSPRLDWQMWWAASSKFEKEPWLLSLAHRLLEGRKEVLALIQSSPFNEKPPKYIRAALYNYKYTTWGERNSQTWWKREKVSDYFPVYTKDSPGLVDYLKARNLLPTPNKQPVNLIWKQILDGVRTLTSQLEATLLLWSIFTAGSAMITTTTRIR